VSIFYNRKINIKAVTKSKSMDHQINSLRTPGQPIAHGTPQICLLYRDEFCKTSKQAYTGISLARGLQNKIANQVSFLNHCVHGIA
jgi:hypothetical protein